jgi:hypothetical protein
MKREPEWERQTCSTASLVATMANCLESATATNCALCLPSIWRLNTGTNACDSMPSGCSSVYAGCLYCSTSACMICDVGFWKHAGTATCQNATTTNQITDCMYHKIDGTTCFQCVDNKVVASSEISCETPATGFEVKLRGCRIFTSTVKNECAECLPYYKAVYDKSECMDTRNTAFNYRFDYRSSQMGNIVKVSLPVDNMAVAPGVDLKWRIMIYWIDNGFHSNDHDDSKG